jgi:putative hemolysin
MKRILTLTLLTIFIALTSCTPPTQPTVDSVPSDIPQADMPNPASAYCVEQGFKSEIRTAADGSQTGYCIFPDGSECEEWAYFRGECGPADQSGSSSSPTEIPTPRPLDLADYQGWWTYTHPIYNFSIMLPEDWVVEEITTFDPLMNHAINLHSREIAPGVVAGYENIRMTFRHVGEDVFLWPTGVGAGEFISQGTLDIAGQPALRWLLVCPNGDVTSIWYHDAEGQPNITRGDLEFGFIYSMGGHCDTGFSLSGKVQRWGEMIIASLKVP